MPYFMTLGETPRKRHTQFRRPDGTLYWEELMGEEGFSGDTSLVYHRNPPNELVAIEALMEEAADLRPNDPVTPLHLTTGLFRPGSDAVSGRRLLVANDDVRISYAAATETSDLYKNAVGDELVYVEKGEAELRTTYGRIAVGEGDYAVIPTSTIHQWVVPEGAELRLLIVAASGHIDPPERYLSDRGQFLEGTPYCELDIRRPEELLFYDDVEVPVLVRTRTGLTRHVHQHHPFDVVGWMGGMYPWVLNIRDIEPITGRLHQPPPMHQTFSGPNFVVCSFVPRMLDYHPEAVPIPPFHANVDSDEFLFYTGGASTRHGTGVGSGSITVHPAGFIHGPHPGNVERSLGMQHLEEYQVMVDTFRPLNIAEGARQILDADYPYTWHRLARQESTVSANA